MPGEDVPTSQPPALDFPILPIPEEDAARLTANPPADVLHPASIPQAAATLPRIRAGGKFFWCGKDKFTLHGATYGPFGPAERNHGLPDPKTVTRDLDDMVGWGANTLRLYHVPPEWFLELCTARNLRVVVSVPWGDHVDFLRHGSSRRAVHQLIHDAASRLSGWPVAAALLVGNEIPSTLVRWLGPHRVQAFIEDLIDTAREAAPDLLIGYANYPGTEYLQPANADFTGFNVYLEERAAFEKYLARLQNLAGDKPLVITEFGVDSLSHGPERQAEILTWQREACLAMGVAGNLIFSWTDEWFRGGDWVTGWAFGLTARSRTPRPAWHALADGPPRAAELLPAKPPRVSVIVCTRNGAPTLRACLESLRHLNYPDYEVILVDDGSTDAVPDIADDYSFLRYIRQEPAGLSVARNTGAAAATGEIFVYTDDDCTADPDWLIYLTRAMEDSSVAAAGGPNIAPPARSLAQACVIASPGGPAHVLLNDLLAEHVPGCNLAVKRTGFDSINGFRPKYHAAGDDVDFCWRLQEAGGSIAFTPAAMVWHDRRTTVSAFLKQQRGYGKAEALLMARHASRFGQLGGARWRGIVYQPAMLRLLHHGGRIYTGVFGYAPFQAIYRPALSEAGWLLTGFPWWLLTAAVAGHGYWFPAMLWIAAGMVLLTLLYTARQSWLLRPARPWPPLRSFLVLWFLLIAQPLSRGWSRFIWNIRLGSAPRGPWRIAFSLPGLGSFSVKPITEVAFWSSDGAGRDELLTALTEDLKQRSARPRADDGWRDWDIEARLSLWWQIRFATVTEYHQAPSRLTRVRLGSRVTTAWIILQVLAAAACASLVAFTHIHPLWAVGLFFVWSMLFEMIHHRAITRAAALTHAAAERCGMIPYLPSRPIADSVPQETDAADS